MVADIRIDLSWRGHPKRAKLKLLLGHDGTGYVLDLWICTAQRKPDGILRGLDDMDISIMAGWPGSPKDFVSALHAVRLLDWYEAESCWRLHDWAEHQPWVIGEPERVARATKAIKARWEKAREVQEADPKVPGRVAPVARKMPEVGPKNGGTVPVEYGENTPRIPHEIREQQSSSTPLQCLSSPKVQRHPPVPSSEGTAPRGGAYSYSPAFEAWWKLYPKKVAKPYAWKCWRKIKGISADVLIQALERQLAVPNLGHFRIGDKVCLPDPSTWLNKGRWTDEIQTCGSGGQTAMERLKARRGGG